MSKNTDRKLCAWSVAALVLSLLPLILVFALTDAEEPLPDGAQYVLFLLGVLISAALPPVAKHLRLKNGRRGKAWDLLALILSAPLNALVAALFISFFTVEGSGSAFGGGWFWGLIPSLASVAAYIWLAGKGAAAERN